MTVVIYDNGGPLSHQKSLQNDLGVIVHPLRHARRPLFAKIHAYIVHQ